MGPNRAFLPAQDLYFGISTTQEITMSTHTVHRLTCLLGLITFALVWLMPQVSYATAQHLFKGVIGCSVAAGLIWIYGTGRD